MAEIINMPRLSDTMEEGTVAKWFKKVGDQINEGDILAEIETDKATMEFESFNEGELLHIGIQEGGTAPVDTLLAIIGEKGEDISNIINGDSSEKEENDNISETTKTVSEDDSKTVIPDEVEIINMPRLSDTMEEGTVAKWFKKVGDKVNEGDILAEIETDKATMEFESFYDGFLLHIGVQKGGTAPVNSLLAIIGDKDEDISVEVIDTFGKRIFNDNRTEFSGEYNKQIDLSKYPKGVYIVQIYTATSYVSKRLVVQ